jgi:nickel-dependent lactate racemase
MMSLGKDSTPRLLNEAEVHALLEEGLAQAHLDGKRVLVLIPDGTRTAPIPLMFRLFHEILRGRALDFLVALGTHQPMDDTALSRLVGSPVHDGWVAASHPHSHTPTPSRSRIFNHRWDLPETFTTIGTLTEHEIRELSQGMLALDVPVKVNKMILDYDQLIVCGPVFPHEVAGFSGGTKYFFPGISGPEVINFTHWLGALITSMAVIGTRSTPVRAAIDRAAAFIHVPTLFCNMVVTHEGLAGLTVGSYEEAWPQAVELSSQLHIKYVERPFKRVLSIMPAMYDDIWTAAKGMYKDYFVKQWERFKDYPWGVLAHSTHLRGDGIYDAESGVERPRIWVTLTTGIPRERCEHVNLGYLDPATINVRDWEGREAEGILVVPHAGEMLYRLEESRINESRI